MCAILDASVVSEVFGEKSSPAGKGFRNHLDMGKLSLVIGGQLTSELNENKYFREWSGKAAQFGIVHKYDDKEISTRAKKLSESKICKSNDEHVIALADISKARLLFSNDQNLHDDFGSKKLIDNPRGKVYSTKENDAFTPSKKKLLEQNVCTK